MPTVYAIHAIRHKPADAIVDVAPKTIFECSDEDHAFFVKAGAVRDPTEAELALYERQTSAAAAAAESAPKPAPAPAPAAAPAKTGAAAPAKDDTKASDDKDPVG